MVRLDGNIRWLVRGGSVALAIAAANAHAADEKGNFAISGAGALSCADFVEAKETDSDRYRLYGSWMSGFFTGFNAIEDATYDIIPWHSADLIASVLYSHCKENGDQPFAGATLSVARQLHPQRIQMLSDKVEVPTGPNQPTSLYKVVVERVQSKLHDEGFYEGAVDGSVGNQTVEAVLSYQKANDMDETGQLDQLTLWRLLQTP